MLFAETELPSMSSAEASPARTSHSLASEQALKVRGLVCGESTGDSLANYDPASSSWRTSQACLVSGWEPFSGTWPRSGMMLGGTVYRLQPSVPLTGATGFGSSPTIPTPGATEGGPMPPDTEYRPNQRSYNSRTGKHVQITTRRFVEMWPTPTRHIHKEQGYPAEYTRNTVGLGAAVKMFPTPSAGDDRDRGCMKMPAIQRRAALGKQLNLSMVVDPDSGALNADWVEWLMGFPISWTQVPGWKNPRASRASSRDKKTEPTG